MEHTHLGYKQTQPKNWTLVTAHNKDGTWHYTEGRVSYGAPNDEAALGLAAKMTKRRQDIVTIPGKEGIEAYLIAEDNLNGEGGRAWQYWFSQD